MFSKKEFGIVSYLRFVSRTNSCSAELSMKLEMCPQYMDAPAVGSLTIKLQNSTWYKCLNLSLTGSRMYICMYVHTYVHTHIRDIRADKRTFICTYPCMHVQKTEKLYAPGIMRCGEIKGFITFGPVNQGPVVQS